MLLSLQQEGTVSLKKGFSIQWDEELSEDQVRRLPRPVLTDLDGDGDVDVVSAASTYKVAVYSNFRSRRAFGDFYQELVPRTSASLTAPVIGLGVGYLSRGSPNGTTPAGD
eukprot:gene33372-23479_t